MMYPKGRRILLCLHLFIFFSYPCILSSQSISPGSLSATGYYELGRKAMGAQDWYTATEYFLEALAKNPSHAESTAALADCYYELREFDQALLWVRRARTLSRGNTDLANLEAFIHIALGRLDAAESVIAEVLVREPYNREALFAAAELELAKGRPGEATARYHEAVRRYPDDRRALLSLALVLGSLGDTLGAQGYISRALSLFNDDYRVYYYAAYLDADAGRLDTAARYLQSSLSLKPDFAPARSLLAAVRYKAGRYEDAIHLADESIAVDRSNIASWYLKGLSFSRLGRSTEALQILSIAVSIDPEDEFVRAALEQILIDTTNLEATERQYWASYHFSRAQDYRSRNLADQALFEYRRGLRINPYAVERREYAELLRTLGYPYWHLEELGFLQELGKADQAVNDAVEAYGSLLSDALHRRWGVDPVNSSSRHWKVAVFSVASQSAYNHVDAATVAAGYIQDLLSHQGDIQAMHVELRQASYSSAFRTARDAGADYFLILSVGENERDLTLKGELYVGRTGSPAGLFESFRTGQDRLRNGARRLIDQLTAALPLRATLIKRRASLALIDKGKADGIKEGSSYQILRKESVQTKNEGIGLDYLTEDVVGTMIIEEIDEFVASGSLSRIGFFDRISAGDEVVLKTAEDLGPKAGEDSGTDPELRSLLRTLR